MYILTVPPTSSFQSLPLLGPLYSLRYNNIEIKPINNLQSPLNVQVRVTPLTVNQKLQISLVAEGMLKAQAGQKAMPLTPVSQVMQRKSS